MFRTTIATETVPDRAAVHARGQLGEAAQSDALQRT